MRTLILSALAIATVPAFAQSPFMSEILWNPTGTDTGYEWFEIQGTPGATISNLYFVVLEGDTGVDNFYQGAVGEQGAIDIKVALPTFTLGSNGTALFRQVTNANPTPQAFFNVTVDPATTIVPINYSYVNQIATSTSFGNTISDLENGSGTFMLVQSATPLWPSTVDVDANNDGVLDAGVTTGITVLSSYGVKDNSPANNTTDKSYGAAFGGYDTNYANPGFVYRVLDTTGNAPGGHVVGFQSGLGSTNFATGPYLLGGGAATDFTNVLPTLTLTELSRLSPGTKNLLWSAPVASTISGNLTLLDTIGQSGTESITWTLDNGINSYSSTISVADQGSSAYSFNIPTAAVNGAYTLKFKGGTFLSKTLNVTLTGSSLTAQNASLKNGDVDQDGEVGPSDFDTVVAQFGGAGDADVDNDNEVGPSDFDIVVANFGAGDQ